MKIPFLTKKIEAIIVKLLILVCDTDLCNKNISKIRNVTFIFQNVQKKFQTKKNLIHMDSEESVNLFEIKWGRLPD